MRDDLILKIIFGLVIAYFFAVLFILISLAEQIENNGGLGKSIGKFINDIESEIEK